jgi:hypothetical protein
VTERRSFKAHRGEFSLAGAPELAVLEAEGVAHAGHVGADIADDQKTIPAPQERDMSCGVARCMDDLQPTGQWQGLTIFYGLVDFDRSDGFVWSPEEAKQNALDHVGRSCHGPEWPAALSDRNIRWMHPCLRPGALDDRGSTSDVIRVGVSEDEVGEILGAAPQRTQCIKDRSLMVRKASIDQHEFAVISFEQNTVDVPEKGALVCPLSRVPSGLP